jgi:hypothetical protein
MGFGHEKLDGHRAGMLFTRDRVSNEPAETIPIPTPMGI